MKNTNCNSGHRNSLEIISNAAWLYYRFTLNFRAIVAVLSCTLFIYIVLLIFCVSPVPVLAQEFSTDETNELSDADSKQPDWQVQAGGLLIYWPEYAGSDEFEATAFPLLAVEYKRRFFLKDGIGIHLWADDRFKLNTSIAYAIGREESDSKHLKGLGDIDAGATFNVYCEYTVEGYSIAAGYINQISGDNTGFLMDLDAGYTDTVSDKLVLKYGMIASYASLGYMEQYFGINGNQSLASGLTAYKPDAGFKSAGLQIGTVYFLPDNWNILSQVKYERLLGDAADSPVVKDENQFSLAFGLGYQF